MLGAGRRVISGSDMRCDCVVRGYAWAAQEHQQEAKRDETRGGK